VGKAPHRAVTVKGEGVADQPLVGVLMGSQSDAHVMDDALKELEVRGIACEVNVLSAHRDPEAVREYALKAESRGLKVIIAGAGKAAALAGVVASMTDLPVIGVPIRTSDLGGLDSLLSTVQMPSGVPVATVAINGARNAAILAAKILRVAGLAGAAAGGAGGAAGAADGADPGGSVPGAADPGATAAPGGGAR
jgi:5-(carboxyamino)imidazole ribonucleotide mutase